MEKQERNAMIEITQLTVNEYVDDLWKKLNNAGLQF
jgi:hypothetical protein